MENFKVFINFKTYPQGSGEEAVELTKEIQEVSKISAVEIVPVVQAVDVYRTKQAVDIPLWVQHVDWQGQGAFTGWQNLEAIIKAGARGTLLNHSEHQIPPGTVKQIISRISNFKFPPARLCQAKRAGQISNFEVMVCCKTLGQMERLVKLKPDYIGYEISELIGGKVSITEANPKAIRHAVEICGKIPLIVGAGINEAEDLKRARGLGASGVLISSSVVLAQKQREKILALLSLLKEG